MIRKVPLIVILGSTGTGKTKLSIELARRFGGEIISADSMQVYKGLDIATAKATQDEQAAAPHHCLDIATPGQLFTVSNFRDKAVPIVDDLLNRSKIPIIVGGTNYYIESLLWKVLVSSQNNYESDDDDFGDDYTSDERHKEFASNDFTSDELLKMTAIQMANVKSTVLHEHLKHIDPCSANRLHPNDQRKIIRAIEVFARTGKTITEAYEEQRAAEGGSQLGGPLRYSHVIMFWLQCQQETLNQRLDKRVDSMVAQGLLPEIRRFYNEFKAQPHHQDYTKGILQTIGFKEFIPYLEQFADEARDGSEAAGALLRECLEELKLVTRRYSKKQIKWVRNRLVAARDRHVPPIYPLDTTDPSQWTELIYTPAAEIVERYIEGTEHEGTLKPMEKFKTPKADLNDGVSHYCDACQRVFVGEYQWNLHVQSNRHKKRLAGVHKRKRKERDLKGSTLS